MGKSRSAILRNSNLPRSFSKEITFDTSCLQETLAIELFPVYVKIDLEEISTVLNTVKIMCGTKSFVCVRAQTPSHALRLHAEGTHSTKGSDVPPLSEDKIGETLSILPQTVTMACEGSVFEFLTHKVGCQHSTYPTLNGTFTPFVCRDKIRCWQSRRASMSRQRDLCRTVVKRESALS